MTRRTLAIITKELEIANGMHRRPPLYVWSEHDTITAKTHDLQQRAEAAEEATAKVQAELAAANATIAHSSTPKEDRIIFDIPHKSPGSKGPASKMGDISSLLERCPDVDDPIGMYDTTLVSPHTSVVARHS